MRKPEGRSGPGRSNRAARRRGSLTEGWQPGRLFVVGGALVLLLGIIVATLFGSGILGADSGNKGSSAADAPDIVLETADGAYRLSDQRGKVVALYFSFPG